MLQITNVTVSPTGGRLDNPTILPISNSSPRKITITYSYTNSSSKTLLMGSDEDGFAGHGGLSNGVEVIGPNSSGRTSYSFWLEENGTISNIKLYWVEIFLKPQQNGSILQTVGNRYGPTVSVPGVWAYGSTGTKCDLTVGIEPLTTSPVKVGVESTLRVNVTNKSGSNSGEVALTVTLPIGISYIGAGQVANIERAGDTTKLKFSIGNVKANKTLDIKIMAKEESRPTGSTASEAWKAEVTAAVAGKSPLIIDPFPGNNTAAKTLNIETPKCDLTVGIEPLTTSPVKVGVESTLRVNVTNKSGSNSGEVALTVTLPKGISYVGAGQVANIERAGDTTKLKFSIGNVKAKKTLDIKIMAKEESRPAGSTASEAWKAKVTAAVASKSTLIIDPFPGNNTAAKTLNIEAPPRVISFNGYVGDIVKLDLANRNNGKPFKLIGLTGTEKGKLIDDQGGNVSIGKQYTTLYFVPAVNGETPIYGKTKKQPASGNSFFDVLDAKQTKKTVRVSIVEGYSGSGGANPVTFGTSKLDVYRQEQRLAYLGYPRKIGTPLIVNGRDDGGESSWARALFDAVIEDKGKVIHPIASISSASRSYLNSANAPLWQELGDGAISGINIKKSEEKGKLVPQTERWATDWAWNVLKAARANYGKNLTLTAGSLEPGGAPGSFHTSHGAGRDLDIDTSPPELLKGYEKNKSFFAEVERNGEMYVLAMPGGSKLPIPSTKPHIIVKKKDGSLGTAPITPDSLKIGLKGSELFNNQAMLSKARDFLLDNTKIGYDLTDVRRQVKSFVDTGGVTRVLNNDPRLWSSPDGLTGMVRYSDKHNGHVHYDISKPLPVDTARRGVSNERIESIVPQFRSSIPSVDASGLTGLKIGRLFASPHDPALVNGFGLSENASAFI